MARSSKPQKPKKPIDVLLAQLDIDACLFQREVRFSPKTETWRQFKQTGTGEGKKTRWHFELTRAPRLWRFDLATPSEGDMKIAVEYDGGTFIKGAHARGAGITADAIKRAHAQLEGWIVITVDAPMVRSGVAVDLVRRAIWKRG
jgi:hypothetical protein